MNCSAPTSSCMHTKHSIVVLSNYNCFSAAHVMYECGMRLETELFTIDGIKRQAKSFLACLNCLKLVSCFLVSTWNAYHQVKIEVCEKVIAPKIVSFFLCR